MGDSTSSKGFCGYENLEEFLQDVDGTEGDQDFYMMYKDMWYAFIRYRGGSRKHPVDLLKIYYQDPKEDFYKAEMFGDHEYPTEKVEDILDIYIMHDGKTLREALQVPYATSFT